jgi:sugar transferase (PEP-CTERM/EpsH1 system associated)
MNILFLSHCVPNPPDKGEKIRSFHEVRYLAARYRLHLACFARDESEVEAARALSEQCASLHVERLPAAVLARAAARFACGQCLNAAYYWSPRMHAYVRALSQRVRWQATLAYAAVMMPYAPEGVPVLLDMQDVDSEKWFQYAERRRPRFLYALEARRLRRFETRCAETAQCTVLTAQREADLLRSLVPGANTAYMENGTDTDFFDGAPHPTPDSLANRRFVAFVGTMDYPPNIEGTRWFADRIFPELQRRHPDLMFLIVGRNPSKNVLKLMRRRGVTVTGAVPDIRPYLSAASAIVAPLLLARGMQNKVLEALAMGRQVFASAAVWETFGSQVPLGVVRCDSEQAFVEQISLACDTEPSCNPAIRNGVRVRFSWPRNLELLSGELERMVANSGRLNELSFIERGLHG